ncbi:phytoene/squalene synthase family protein [Colwellia sp. C1TZA3]|nr:phytoene/squalene synthase family protein [Colwellia sp. C1TZA3]
MDNLQSDNISPKELLARHGKSFYWASLFLGSKLATSAAQLYKFCRFVDDLADGNHPNRQALLEDIRACLNGHKPPVDSEVEDFLALATQHNIPLAAARELLDGMLNDQTPAAFENETELLRYCYAVAGTVGIMMCRVLNCKEQRAESFAIDLGIAMQLTNIARDVLEDAHMGRRYLPASWVNLTASEITHMNTTCHEPVALAIKRMLDLAEDYYKSALLGIQLLPFRSRFSIIVALRVYRQIGVLLRHRNLCWWHGRVYVAAPKKALLSLRSIVDLRPIKVPAHNKQLHRHLKGLSGVASS